MSILSVSGGLIGIVIGSNGKVAMEDLGTAVWRTGVLILVSCRPRIYANPRCSSYIRQ